MAEPAPAPHRRSVLACVLLALSVLASVTVVGIFGFLASLIIAGYSGGSDPASVAPLAFPIALLFFVIVGLPSLAICAGLWAGYAAAVRRHRGRGRSA